MKGLQRVSICILGYEFVTEWQPLSYLVNWCFKTSNKDNKCIIHRNEFNDVQNIHVSGKQVEEIFTRIPRISQSLRIASVLERQVSCFPYKT